MRSATAIATLANRKDPDDSHGDQAACYATAVQDVTLELADAGVW